MQPGPFQTYVIGHTLDSGWRRTLPVALAPLLSDGPIILLALLVLNQMPSWLERVLYVAGGLFVLYLAASAFREWQRFDENEPAEEASTGQSVLKAAMTNALNPAPYVFWLSATGPILLDGWREGVVHGLGFLAAF